MRMASLHKQPGRPHWFCAFTGPDGKRRFKSTGTSDKRQAKEICNTWARSSELGKAGKLTDEKARSIVARGLEDILAATGQTMSSASTRQCLENWLNLKKLEACQKTHRRYKVVVDELLQFLGAKADRDIAVLSAKELTDFRNELAKRVSPGTVNIAIKVIRAALNHAYQESFVSVNEAKRVKLLKVEKTDSRKAFTEDQLRKIIAKAEGEWRGMILLGLYTGLRLGDVSTLTWDKVDLRHGRISLATSKTGRIQVLPITPALRTYLGGLAANSDSKAPIFPNAFQARERSHYGGTLSNQFHRILVAADIATARPHVATGIGRSSRRQPSEFSFHSLRHSATSLLKNAGVSDVIVRDIIGHDSPAVSRVYTHIDDKTKKQALEPLPDITTAPSTKRKKKK
jgi:integrase